MKCCNNNSKNKEENKDLELDIKYLYVDGCHAWLDGIKALSEALLEEKINPKYEVICIINEDLAKEFKFCGSPAIMINGEDIDEMAKFVKNYTMASCRPYNFEGESYEFPPKEMIVKKLRKLIYKNEK